MPGKFTIAAFLAIASMAAGGLTAPVTAQEIPRSPATPHVAKNWRAPAYRIKAQAIIDRLIAIHPEIMTLAIHAVPAGMPADAFTMIASSLPDRIGNETSPGVMLTARKGVSQVESKWGTPDFGKKVSLVLPLKTSKDDYIPVAIVIAYHHNPALGMRDTDYLAPGVALRNALAPEIASVATLFEQAN